MCILARLSFGNYLLLEENHQKSNNVGVERGVATRRAQMVWPMMTDTVTNFKGFIRQQNLQKCEFRSENAQCH